jgi:glycosyltransferase involved in cell wall biosynthesis
MQAALDSILHQTYRNLEILLIDDGSTDETHSIIERNAASDSRIRLFQNEKNLGIVATLNNALSLATGEYITYMHADDISALNRIEMLLNYIINNLSTDLVAAGYWWINEKGKVSSPIYPKTLNPKSIKFTVFLITPMPHPVVLGKKEVFQKLRYDPDYEYSEDYDLFSRVALSNCEMRNINVPLYYIRLSKTRLSYLYHKLQYYNHIRISIRNFNDYFGFLPNPSVHKIAVNRMDSSADAGEIREALKMIDVLQKSFVEREECSDVELVEIDKVVKQQKIDILIQSIKFSGWKQIIYLLPLLPILLKLLMHREVLNYIKMKLILKAQTASH